MIYIYNLPETHIMRLLEYNNVTKGEYEIIKDIVLDYSNSEVRVMFKEYDKYNFTVTGSVDDVMQILSQDNP